MDIEDVINNICTKEIAGKKINDEPMCVLIGGVAGAGKTNLAKKIEVEYSNRDFVDIDADYYRKLHPNYETLIKTPEKAINETSDFSNAIEAELIKTAIENHCDIISSSTLRATEIIVNALYFPTQKLGYKTEIDVMAVPINECALSAAIRYERQIASGECPRYPSIKFIQDSILGIKKSIEFFESRNETVKIYCRGNGEKSFPKEIYNSKAQNGNFKSAVEAFTEYSKPLENDKAIELIEDLYKIKRARNANISEYDLLEKLEELFSGQIIR